MKKLVVVLVLLGGGAYAAYHFGLIKPERRGCSKLAELCGLSEADAAQCTEKMADLAKQANSTDSLSKFGRCVGEAKTCPEATGCVVGAGAGMVGDALGDFAKGLGRALAK